MSTERNLLRTILENHILKLKITLSELYSGQLLETLAGKLLRVFIYRTVRNVHVYPTLRGGRVKHKLDGHIIMLIFWPVTSIYIVLYLQSYIPFF